MIESLRAGLDAFFAFIPQLIGAIVILVVGYIVAKILQAVVARVLKAVGFDGWMERGGIKQFFDRAQTRETPATVLGKLVFWFVFIITITMSADALEAVMNSIRNSLGMREIEIAREPSRPWSPHFYAIFAQVHNTL